MELDKLISTWKAQDQYMDQKLKTITLDHLLRQKSKGALSQIVKKLTVELIGLVLLLAGFNWMFFIIDLPHSILRWICFAIFNLVIIGVILNYAKTIIQSRIDFRKKLDLTLSQIIKNLNRFRTHNQYLNIPVGVICILMFAGSQDIVYWIPWLLAEFFVWRWLITPKIRSRFENYIADLEYSFNTLTEMKI